MHKKSPNAAFSFLSGNGADLTGRSRIAFARYKGEAEKELIAAGFPRIFLFRPAYIYPVQPRKEPNLSYRLLRAAYPVFRALFPNQVIRADNLAWAMVNVVVRHTEKGQEFVTGDLVLKIVISEPWSSRESSQNETINEENRENPHRFCRARYRKGS